MGGNLSFTPVEIASNIRRQIERRVAVVESHILIVEVLYPGLTQLDFTGPHTIFSRIPGADVIVASEVGGPIESDDRLTFAGTKRMRDIARCDLLFVMRHLS
jgi:cyclohexyl-isocyanide hydratase